MKKLTICMLVLAMVCALAACGTQKEAAPAVGGWTPTEGAVIEESSREAFDKAMEGFVGVSYTPVAQLATQLVAGTNVCLLCEAQGVYPGAQPYYALVYLYCDLQGGAQIQSIVPLSLGDIAAGGTVKAAEQAPGPLMGGWTVNRESAFTVPGALLHLGSQVVAGTNHCLLGEGNELLFVYENLEGKTEITQRVPIDVAALAG